MKRGFLALAPAWALVLGCVGPEGGPPGDGATDGDVDAGVGGGTDADPASCVEACAAKSSECGAPADAAALECDRLCAGGATATEVDCLRSTSCAVLTAAFAEGDDVCGLGGPPVTPDGGPPGGDAGSGDCVIGDRQCPEDFVAFRCEELLGRPLPVTERCPPSQPCEHGWCVDSSLPGLQSSCRSASDCREPALCEADQCCNPPNEVCFEDADCCGGGPCEATSFGFRACR